MDKRYYSIKELINLGYGSRDTILQHIHTGDFSAKNPGGGKWIVDLKEYEEWLTSRTRKPRHRYRRKRK